MPELLEHSAPTGSRSGVPTGARIQPAAGGRARVREDAERRARDDLRRQIGELERQLGELFSSAFPRSGIEFGVPAAGGPRVLGVADLEAVRDALATRLQKARAELSRRVDVEEENRGLLEEMIAQPDRYRWVRVSNEDVGEPGCRHWHSRPRWGLLGMILGWWRVKLSSGCPLPPGVRPGRVPPQQDSTEVARKSRKRRRRGDGRRPPPVGAESSAGTSAPPRPPAARATRARRQRPDDRPPAPWGSFPLVELVVLVAIVMLVGGLIVAGTQGTVMVGTGLALGGLAGLELSVREHLAGYRSHTLLLSAATAVAVLGLLFFLAPAELPPLLRIAAAAAVFALAAWWLIATFRRRSGGYAFRVK
jgi:hypothetical protein